MKLFLSIPLIALLAACGGGGGGGSSAALSLILTPAPPIDGFGTSLATLTNSGVSVGDDEFNAVFRGYYGFDVQSIPAGAVIQTATLRVYLGGTVGTPNASYGPITLDHKRTGASLSAFDFALGDLEAAFATLPAVLTIGYHDIDVTAQVQADITAARARSGFRLRGAQDDTPDSDGSVDVHVFSDSENSNGFGNPPQLVITYTLP